jgi:hypothetical protein
MPQNLRLSIEELISSSLLVNRKLKPFITELKELLSFSSIYDYGNCYIVKTSNNKIIDENTLLSPGSYNLHVFIIVNKSKSISYNWKIVILSPEEPPEEEPPEEEPPEEEPPEEEPPEEEPLLPLQFKTKKLDLNLKKGESAQFSVTITDYDLDLRGSLVFTEILRQGSPGFNLIQEITGTVNSGSNTIQIKRYPTIEDKSELLSLLPIRIGDLITLEGSGITSSKVISVTASEILCDNTATLTIDEGRVLVRSASVASFNAIPYSPIISLTLTETAGIGSTQIKVSGVSRNIPTGTILAFEDNGSVKTATVAVDVNANNTVIKVNPLSTAITIQSIAKVGSQVITTTNSSLLNSTSIDVEALDVTIPSDTLLNFATRSSDGWVYRGSATLSAPALTGDTTLSVSPLTVPVPTGAIAWFGTVPFNSFYLRIDPPDTQFLESGEYGYDVICRLSDGYTIRIIQGNCTFTDHWSDGF